MVGGRVGVGGKGTRVGVRGGWIKESSSSAVSHRSDCQPPAPNLSHCQPYVSRATNGQGQILRSTTYTLYLRSGSVINICQHLMRSVTILYNLLPRFICYQIFIIAVCCGRSNTPFVKRRENQRRFESFDHNSFLFV